MSNPYLPATQRQIPDQAIMDFYNRPTYLGNAYSVNKTFSAVGTGEANLLLLQNNSSGMGLFQNLLRVTENTAAHSVLLNIYANPTVAAKAVQTVALVADSSGSLNSTFFLLDSATVAHKYYVWFNINSAGVDPAVAGRTGIEVDGATDVTAATLGAAMVVAINAAAPLDFHCAGTSTVTITNLVNGPMVPAVEGSAPTGFTFAVTAGAGIALTPQNLRLAYGNHSIAQISYSPISSASGVLVDTISASAQSVSSTNLLKILDLNQSLLITSIASASSTSINALLQWYEL